MHDDDKPAKRQISPKHHLVRNARGQWTKAPPADLHGDFREPLVLELSDRIVEPPHHWRAPPPELLRQIPLDDELNDYASRVEFAVDRGRLIGAACVILSVAIVIYFAAQLLRIWL